MLPGPTNVPSRVMRAMAKPVINHRGPEFRELYRRMLDNLKFVFETKGDVFVFTASGTGGVECAIRNILSNGDKIAVPVNGVFSERLRNAVTAFGGKGIEIPIDWGSAITPAQVEELFKKEKNIKALAVVYNETSTGATTRNLKEMGKICHDNGALFVVDAISILGGDALPVDEWGVDMCVAGSQKCLMTPPGLVMLSVNDRAWKVAETARRSYYFDLLEYRKFLANYETPYTPAVTLFYALDEALLMIREEGLQPRYDRHNLCARSLYAGLEALGFQIFPRAEFRSQVVVAANYLPEVDDKKFRDLLRERYHVVVAGGMGKLKGTMFRIGVMGTVSEFEILTTIGAIESTLVDLGIRFEYGIGSKASRDVFGKQN
ncbi:MAG: alanine--glyoxylate aminotransferase family protein [Candidatus Bathyarchaeia archaeon]